MKRIAIFLIVTLAGTGIGRATFHAGTAPEVSLSKYVPASPLLYLEAKDFSSLLGGWNSSTQKTAWTQSDNYEVFSRSRLFLRLQGAGAQFAVAAGIPPDADFFSQIAGERSALAVYDIGKLQFLYITYLPSARSMQNNLWQTRAKFEPRNADGLNFYLRRDPESQREVAFAVSGDYLLLATREDLIAGALQLISGKQGRTVESEPWWATSTAAAGQPGDLRMVLDLKDLVPNGYFRTYWVQQNITDLAQYSAAVSDLFRSNTAYREERVLIRKKESPHPATPEGMAAVADLSRLIPDGVGVYASVANPGGDSCFALLETELLPGRIGPVPVSHSAPPVVWTSGEQGGSSDLETRIDQVPAAASSTRNRSGLKELLNKSSILASLQLLSSKSDHAGVFVRLRSTVVLAAASDWDETAAKSAIVKTVTPALTASQLGVGWVQKPGFQEFDGLWPIAVSIRGKYLILSDDPAMMETVLANFSKLPKREPLELYAGFNHDHERPNFARFMGQMDNPSGGLAKMNGLDRQPQFFSGNVASLSSVLSDVAAERVEVRSEAEKVRQTVIYEWSK